MEGSLTVLAEKGCVKIGGQYLNTIEYQRIGSVVLPPVHTANPSNQYGSYQGSMSNHPQVIENVIRTLQGRDTAMTNAHEGRSVVEMIEAMYAGCRL